MPILDDSAENGPSRPKPDEFAEHRPHMERAIAEARKCKPEDTGARPYVGVVAVKDGKVLGTAYRGEMGSGDHAEFTLLEKKLKNETLAGATIYTTLEPCTFRNPPKRACVEWLKGRRVARVFIGQLDPNEDILGRGQRGLVDANIEAQMFPHDLQLTLEELNRDFKRAHEVRSKRARRVRRIGLALAAIVVVVAVVLLLSRHASSPSHTDRAWLAGPSNESVDRFMSIGGVVNARLSFTVTNTGEFAANDIEIRREMYGAPMGSEYLTEPIEHQKKLCDEPRDESRPVGRTSLAPHESRKFEIGPSVPNPNGSWHPIIVGCIRYVASPGEPHKTGFIYDLGPPVPGVPGFINGLTDIPEQSESIPMLAHRYPHGGWDAD